MRRDICVWIHLLKCALLLGGSQDVGTIAFESNSSLFVGQTKRQGSLLDIEVGLERVLELFDRIPMFTNICLIHVTSLLTIATAVLLAVVTLLPLEMIVIGAREILLLLRQLATHVKDFVATAGENMSMRVRGS